MLTSENWYQQLIVPHAVNETVAPFDRERVGFVCGVKPETQGQEQTAKDENGEHTDQPIHRYAAKSHCDYQSMKGMTQSSKWGEPDESIVLT